MTLDEWRERGRRFTHRGHWIFYRVDGRPDATPVLLCIHGFPTASWDWQPRLGGALRPLRLRRGARHARIPLLGQAAPARVLDARAGGHSRGAPRRARRRSRPPPRPRLRRHGGAGAAGARRGAPRARRRRARARVVLPPERRPLSRDAPPDAGAGPPRGAGRAGGRAHDDGGDLRAGNGARVRGGDAAERRGDARFLAPHRGERRRGPHARSPRLHGGAPAAARALGRRAADDAGSTPRDRRRRRPGLGRAHGPRYRELVPNPDAVLLPGIGHYPQVEDPTGVKRAFLEFHARLGTPAP